MRQSRAKEEPTQCGRKEEGSYSGPWDGGPTDSDSVHFNKRNGIQRGQITFQALVHRVGPVTLTHVTGIPLNLQQFIQHPGHSADHSE